MVIKVSIIADSISPSDIRLTTFELEYPRFIHSELMTHRMFSRNAASSRAIPVKTMIQLINSNPAKPIHWGQNQSGMVANEELKEPYLSEVKSLWDKARENTCNIAIEMSERGAHKQIVNRILEPFQIIKTVLTATEFSNFFYLRTHKDAQPEIRKLASLMLEAYLNSSPVLLDSKKWHTPYYGKGYWSEDQENTLEEALAISASCCAQVSYRKLDDSLDKAKDIFKRLVETKPVHASPFEHQATPMDESHFSCKPEQWSEKGITHMTSDKNLWSGNLRGWIQYRQLIPGHVYNNPVK